MEEADSALQQIDFRIYPNPTTDAVTISFTGKNQPITLRIFNPLGQQLLEKQLQPISGRIQESIELNVATTARTSKNGVFPVFRSRIKLLAVFRYWGVIQKADMPLFYA